MDKDKRPEVTLRAMEPEDLDVLSTWKMIMHVEYQYVKRTLQPLRFA